MLLPSYNDIDKDDRLGTIDIETYTNDKNESNAYSIGFKQNLNSKIYYLDEFECSDEMILKCINDMLIKDNHNMKFYAHNMSEFDGILILKTLLKTSNKHDFRFKISSDNEGKIMSIDIIKKLANKQIVKISILDSFLILPVSLFNLRRTSRSRAGGRLGPCHRARGGHRARRRWHGCCRGRSARRRAPPARRRGRRPRRHRGRFAQRRGRPKWPGRGLAAGGRCPPSLAQPSGRPPQPRPSPPRRRGPRRG